MEEELRALILGDAGINAFVFGRVNWGVHPQGEPYPAIVLNVVSGGRGFHMNGPTRLFEGRVQVDCYGLKYGQPKKLGRAVSELLNGYRGGGLRFMGELSVRDDRATGTNEAERPYRVSMDYKTAWRAE